MKTRQLNTWAKQFFYLQMALVIGVVSMTFYWFEWSTAKSVLLGGLLCLLPTTYYAFKVLSPDKLNCARALLRRFYWAQVVKMSLTAVMGFIVLKWVSVRLIPFILGFIAAQLAYIWGPFTIGASNNENN